MLVPYPLYSECNMHMPTITLPIYLPYAHLRHAMAAVNKGQKKAVTEYAPIAKARLDAATDQRLNVFKHLEFPTTL